MAYTVRSLVDAFETISSPRLAEPWDNVGLLVGDPAQPLGRVLLAIDYTPAVAAEARSLGCQAVVAYHPPIFQAKKRVVAGDGIFEAIRDGIALYSPHTALDVARGGTNDVLCDLLGVAEREPLRLSPGSPQPGENQGIGRVAVIPPTGRAELVERARRGLGLEHVLAGGPMEGEVTRVAVCAGAGGELLDAVLSSKAQFFLTGELRHHDVLRAARAGVTVVCALHSNSERVTLAHLRGRIEALLPELAIVLSTTDTDPLRVVGAREP
jgi:dinuclear metal center YbgI/SA1388 family protein